MRPPRTIQPQCRIRSNGNRRWASNTPTFSPLPRSPLAFCPWDGDRLNVPFRIKLLLAVVFFWLHQPVLAFAEAQIDRDGGPHLSSTGVFVINNTSRQILLGRHLNEQHSIASLTKLQAALVFIDRGLKLDQGTVVTRDDWKVALQGCRTRLELNWTYRNLDLLHALLMASDNRAVSALGRAVGLSPNGLVQAMNERAKRKGLKHTQFQGPAGIEYGNVSTAQEMGQIVQEASRNKVLRAIMGKSEYQVKPIKGYLKVYYRNTNPLIGKTGPKFFASKTGYNARAGYCLATVVQVGGLGNLTIVLLGSKRKADRITDLKKIIRWLH